ncbi:MAG: TIGR03086 family metal-binding protein [Dehalococcoidia bacterium]
MTQQGPNPIELYEGAVQSFIPILSGIGPEQLGNATPCSEWSVQNVINHNLRVAQFSYDVLAQTGAANLMANMEVSDPLPAEGAAEALRAATNRVLEVVKAPGKLEQTVETPFGAIPAGHFLMIPFGDILIHKWDLAKGANLDTSIDSSLAEASHQALSQSVEGARQGGFFGAEVTVPISASIQDKLLALSGRQP